MFDYLAMTYKDSDYTIMIAVNCALTQMYIFGAEIKLGVLLSSHQPRLLKCTLWFSLAV